MKIGVVGFGYVGKALARYFSQRHEIVIYDKYLAPHNTEAKKADVNSCDLTFVAVPTVTGKDGWSCDLTELEDAFAWLTTPTCIKSTIPPGTTSRLTVAHTMVVGFSPEYIGESAGHRWNEIDTCGFVVVGGPRQLIGLVDRAYREINCALTIHSTQPTIAEVCKYMENAFLATKVAFVNQFYDIALAFGVDFGELVKLWQLDSRIGSSHCLVTPERGFGGKCLPKDMRAIIAATESAVSTDLLRAVLAYNDALRQAAREAPDQTMAVVA